jgi:O-antigen ligase
LSSSATASRSRAILAILAPVFLALALVFGGATHGEAISSALVRLAAVGLLAVALWTLAETGLRPGARWPAAVLAGAALLPLIQLLPLPPELWTELPGREAVAVGFRAAGMDLPWMPISLAPSATIDAFLSMVPPAAIFLATINLDERSRRRLSLIIVGVAILATVMGAAQVASGTDSGLRIYQVTNADSAVGFFANRNHQAALLVVALPLTAYWLGYSEGRSRGQHVVYMMVAAGLLVIFLVSLGVTRSRAGIGLGIGALVASGVLLWFSSAVPRIVPLILMVGLIAGGGLVAAFALEPLLARFQDPVSGEARVTLLPALIAAGKAFWPIGSGLGSFVPAFQLFERPDTLLPQFVNHAHNDYIELWIEAGALGLLLLTAGLSWFVTAAVRVVFWPSGRDADLPRVAAIIVLILVVHSAVDYPLRTAALSVVFALACGLLTPPPSDGRRSRRRSSQPANDAVLASAVSRLPSRPSVTTRARRS